MSSSSAVISTHRGWVARYRLPFVMGAIYLGLSTLTRLLLLTFHASWFVETPLAVARCLGAGLVFDLLAAAWWLLPPVLYLTFFPERWFAGARHRRALVAIGAAVIFAWLFAAAAELVFFSEFDGRFNFVATDYLLYPTEVGENIWQSYPTGWILLGLAVATWFAMRPLGRAFAPAWSGPDSFARRCAGLAGFLGGLALLTIAVPPGLAHVSENRALNEVATNGHYSFWQALRGADAPYEGLYPTLEEPEIERRLERILGGVTGRVHLENGSTQRRIASPGPLKQWNVVVVLEESLGSEFSSLLSGRTVSLTPELDRLAAEGTLLTQAYSTGNRTIRAIEATTTSLPPLPGASIVRRTQSKGLFTLPSQLAGMGYQTAFVYGGRALFDGVGGFLSANGVERLVDQGDMPDGSFHNAWGVADEVTFDRALVEMDAMAATGRPFYSLVLTVSNHRPYTFPTDAIQPLPGLVRRENAVRYADYALGRFLRLAKEHSFYSDTLFVLMGDHGARVYGAAEIPLGSYEIPILFLGPGIEAGRKIETLASSLDVPSTILARLGVTYESKFFGQDVFTVDPADGRAIVNHNSKVAMLRGGEIAVLDLHRRIELFRYSREKRTLERIDETPGDQLVRDTIAVFDGADRAFRRGYYQSIPPALAAAGR